MIPFFKDIMPQLGLFYIVLSYFVIVGTGNAVNLTDGLDGLAIMPTALVAGAFALIAWATGMLILQNTYISLISNIAQKSWCSVPQS